jgi:hypothetical protein
MCVAINWKGERVATQKELTDKVGRDIVESALGDSPYEPEVCLCPVDVPTVLKKAGVGWVRSILPEYKVGTP